MKFKILGYIYLDKNKNRERVFNVEIGNDTIKGIEAFKLKDSRCRNCKHKLKCRSDKVYRKYDCKKLVQKLNNRYILFTAFLVAIFAYYVFSHFDINFFYKCSILLLSLTGFDIVCTLLEKGVINIYDWLFYRKLKKMLKEQKKQEAKVKEEEEAKLVEIPGYKGVKNAREITQKFSEITKRCDYGVNTPIIENCMQSCEVIMKILEKDASDYYRVSDVFEKYLPKVCAAMEMYKKETQSNKANEQIEILFTKFIANAAIYLSKKKNEAIYYNNGDELNLEESTDNLIKSIEEEDQK